MLIEPPVERARILQEAQVDFGRYGWLVVGAKPASEADARQWQAICTHLVDDATGTEQDGVRASDAAEPWLVFVEPRHAEDEAETV